MSKSIDSLKAFVSTSGRSPSHTPLPGVLAVGSGKGGAGTSTVAALLALETARRGEQVLLIDADESVGSLHTMFGMSQPTQGIGMLRRGLVEPDALLQPVTSGLTLIPGGGGGIDATFSRAAGERRAMMRRLSELFPRYSTVVIDGGSRLESVMVACSLGVERLLCVTSPDRLSLAANYALFKVARTRFETLPIELVVNGTEERHGRNLHSVVRSATQSFLGTDVRFGGTIPVDSLLQQGLELGRSISELTASPAMSAAGSVTHRLLSERSADFGPVRLAHLPVA